MHLIRPLGFEIEDKRMRRAGLDYHEYVAVTEHGTLPACLESLGHPRVVAISTRGQTRYDEHRYDEGDAILFGPETRGLPADVLERLPGSQVLRIPMQTESRSLNLSNAAAVVLFEAWRQNGFPGGH